MNQNEHRITELEDELRTVKATLALAERDNETLMRQEDLEKLSRRQAILIKVLQIVQSAEYLYEAMYDSLAEIGKYAGVSRIHVFEKSADGTTISNTVEWCNDGMESTINFLQDIPIKIAQPLFDMFEAGWYVSAADNKKFKCELSDMLMKYGVKSVVVFPLSSGSFNYGFVIFDECIHTKEWEKHEVELLKNLSEILSSVKRRFHAEQELIIERDRLKSIGDNFPNGALFRWKTNTETQEIRYSYLSETWTNITGLDIQKSLDDISYSLSVILPEDLEIVTDRMFRSVRKLEHYFAEIRINHIPSGEIRWMQIAARPHFLSNNNLVYDGFIFDVTTRKNTEIELEKLSLRQAILINVLHVVQSAENLPLALNESIADVGRYAGVSRVNVFEKNDDRTTFSNTFEWCNDGITSNIANLKNIPLAVTQSWLDMFGAGRYVCVSDSATLKPELSELLMKCGVKSFVVCPLSSGSINYGFVLFEECNANREWDNSEVALFRSFSQIISATKRRFHAEQELLMERDRLKAIGDNFPGGALFRLEANPSTMEMRYTYLSETWESVTGLNREESIADMSKVLAGVFPEYIPMIMKRSKRSIMRLQHFLIEIKFLFKGREIKWIQISSYPRKVADNLYFFDGFILDITARKEAEIKLGKHHEDLGKLSQRQDVLINILQIMQFPVNFHQAIDNALAEIGKYAGVSRSFIMEKNDGGTSVSLTHEWCNTGIRSSKSFFRNIHIAFAQRWFDLFEENEIRCFTDLQTLDAETISMLESVDVKSIAILPLVNYDGDHYGFIGFDECFATRVWNMEDMELLKSVSQIISISAQRYSAETNLLSLSSRQTVLIKVLQIVQSAENLHQAINEALAEVGNYAQVCRVHIYEKSPDGKTYGCSYEWCDEYIKPVCHLTRNLPIEEGRQWFDMLSANPMICTSNIYSLPPEISGMLEAQRVKAIVSLPMSIFGSQLGFINFTVCRNKIWETKEVKLLSNISQILTNVIRRLQVETAMNLSQQTMRTVLDNVNASIMVTEYDTLKILFANQKFKETTGIEGEGEGKICWQSINSGLTAPCEQCPRASLLDSDGNPTGLHHRENYNPITERWHIITSTAIRWVNGQLAVLETATDITDLKLNEIELTYAREKAEESDKLKSAFLANMSHEIRTPLNAIVGFLNIIAADNLLPATELDYFSIIKNNAEQLVQLINDIIDVAKIEAKQMCIAPLFVDINELMNDLHKLFITVLQTNNKERIALLLDENESVENLIVLVDPTRLRQVLHNLLNNAIKYTEQGYIRFGYRQASSDKLEFVVEDTGIGIPPDQHQVIFERFRQASNQFRGGTGLGLNIAQSLVQMMGGDIWVESSEGTGSTFYFTISYQQVKKMKDR